MYYCCYSLCSASKNDLQQMDWEFSEELHKKAKTKKLRYGTDWVRFSGLQVAMQIYARLGNSAVLQLGQVLQVIWR